jgi:hypothetical protein
MRRLRLGIATFVCLAGCSDDPSLQDFLPQLPAPTGDPQAAFAGQVTDPSQLIPGPAQSGLVGDYFIKNDKVSFIIQSPTRVLGVIPQGGNVVDAALADGTQLDQFGELGMMYLVGRTCDPDHIEIVRDGSKGGVAVIRAIGKSANDDFINIKAFGVLPVDQGIDPDIDDGVQCATTYVLAPGATSLEVYHSLFNGGPDEIDGPFGVLADSGGNTEGWTNTRGFERADITALAILGNPTPSDYVIYQAPGVAYGVIPRDKVPTVHTHALLAGVSVLLEGNSYLLEILQKDKYFLHMKPGGGYLGHLDLVVGRDANDIDRVWRDKEALRTITGHVNFSAGGAAAGARVGFFRDGNGNGVLDEPTVDDDGDHTPDDLAVSYVDVAPDGSFTAQVPTTAGNLFVRAEVKNVGRSQVAPVADDNTLTIPSPVKVDFQILDADTGMPIPGVLLVVGDHPVFPDRRLFETYDRSNGVVTMQNCIRGTTVDVGDGTDPALYVPAGGTYRIYASHGTEWSVASQPVSGTAVPTDGYLATEWHVHMLGSPDSPVTGEERVRGAVANGVEMFAITDHDYVSDLQPIVEQLGLTSVLRVLPGIEVTPFAYGHYMTWPIAPDPTSANRGAIDWARGASLGLAMTPGEIYDAMRARGGQMVQVNHPRSNGLGEFQAAFSRANVQYDFAQHTIYGDYQNASTPNDWLRLPEDASLWSDKFNGLEIWNGFAVADSNGDGLRENKSLDRVTRDWLSMLSMGMYVTPSGSSDTHTVVADPPGMPRTFVRVADDSPTALMSPTSVDEVLQTQTGANGAPRDIVVTDGPMIDVKVNNAPALGRVVSSVNQPVTLTVTVTAADWAPFDTLEVFANTTPDPVGKDDNTVLVPLKCWTSRALAALDPKDPCKTAALAPEAMTVQLATLPGGGQFKRYEATVQVTLDPSDISTRAGATGTDAWLVFRARGDRGIFPILIKGDTVTPDTLPTLVGGDTATITTTLQGHGVPAEAITAPVFVDFDGNGYRAPFAP